MDRLTMWFEWINFLSSKLIHLVCMLRLKQKNWIESRKNQEDFLRRLDTKISFVLIKAQLIGIQRDQMRILLRKYFTFDEKACNNSNNEIDGNEKSRSLSLRMKCSTIVAISLLIGLISLWYQCTACNRYAYRLGRRTLIKLEKHWNWIDIYYDRCLVPLGTYQDQPSTIKFQNWHQKMESVCDFCSEVQQIVQLNRLNHSAAFDRDEEFLDRLTFLIANKIPFLVQNDSYFRDEINRWPIRKEFSTVKLLQKNYRANDGNGICQFRSNLVNAKNPIQFLDELSHHQPNTAVWFAQWQNCALWQSKFLRRYYHRPTLLPPMIELTRPNWILISSPNTSSKNVSKANSLKSITPSARTDLIAIIQIHGSIGLELQAFPPTTPSPPSLSLDCQKRCKNLSSIVVEENNLVIVSPKYWRIRYESNRSNRSNRSDLNLSLLLEAILDH